MLGEGKYEVGQQPYKLSELGLPRGYYKSMG